MGLMDKIWDEVFAGPQPTTNPANGKMDGPATPRSTLDRAVSMGNEQPSPAPVPSEAGGKRASNDFLESRSVRPTASQRITITPSASSQAPGGRPALDTSRSLPSGFRYVPEILSPGSRRGGESVWRSVFDPGSNRAMDRVGAAKFDKADSKGPSVYDWYNPLTT